ncbi:hypothetical protein [Streptomyces sp. NPDC052225]|uniref:hypothetical protein n=1 Tax=Streptomyces sp. NPDC052225 TaxID=3154949 RepID=UPI00342A7EA5
MPEHEQNRGRTVIEVAYGTGYDARRGAVRGAMSREAASALDAAGDPYAVVLREPGRPEAVVVHVARAAHFVGIWAYDAHRRRLARPT